MRYVPINSFLHTVYKTDDKINKLKNLAELNDSFSIPNPSHKPLLRISNKPDRRRFIANQTIFRLFPKAFY